MAAGAARLLAGALILFMGAGGCERKEHSPPIIDPPALGHTYAQITALAPASAGARTHLLIDSLGNIYFSQESERGDDVMFTLAQGNVPQATGLTSNAILKAMGQPRGEGNIQSLAIGAEDNIYFFFKGGCGRHILAAVGQYAPRQAQLRILASTASIEAASGMGDSLELARGSLLRDNLALGYATIYLWLRHTDGGLILNFNPGDGRGAAINLTPLGAPAANPGSPPLNSMLEDMSCGPMFVPVAPSTTAAGATTSLTPRPALYYIDRRGARLWRINPESGQTTPIHSLYGVPSILTPPVSDGHAGLIMAAGESPFLANKSQLEMEAVTAADAPEQLSNPVVAAAYPALLHLLDGKLSAIGKDDLRCGAGIPLEGLAPAAMLPDRLTRGWIAYDAASGQIVRITLTNK